MPLSRFDCQLDVQSRRHTCSSGNISQIQTLSLCPFKLQTDRQSKDMPPTPYLSKRPAECHTKPLPPHIAANRHPPAPCYLSKQPPTIKVHKVAASCRPHMCPSSSYRPSAKPSKLKPPSYRHLSGSPGAYRPSTRPNTVQSA